VVDEDCQKEVAFASLLGHRFWEMGGLETLSSRLESASTTRAARFRFRQAAHRAAAWTREACELPLGRRLAVLVEMLTLWLAPVEIRSAGCSLFAAGMGLPKMWLAETLSSKLEHLKMIKVEISGCSRDLE